MVDCPLFLSKVSFVHLMLSLNSINLLLDLRIEGSQLLILLLDKARIFSWVFGYKIMYLTVSTATYGLVNLS